jgi:hypothetical protein
MSRRKGALLGFVVFVIAVAATQVVEAGIGNATLSILSL